MLEVKHLRRVYKVKNGSPVYALDDVSLKFPETGLVFILGKSGSGKSTLLNVMGGLDKIDDGEIIINGKSSKEFSGGEMDSYRNTYLGFIFQEYNILNDFTVKENIGLALQLQHKKATDEEIEKILAEVDLTGYGKRKPNELSGGQKQRVAIARALVKEPKIIFGDEPTGALDSNTGKQVFETLKKLSKDKLVVIVSHDRDFAEHFGDRVIELKDGKVISDITKKSVQAKQEQPGLTILGDNVIRIEKGHALTMDDLAVINKALANQENDTFITADAHVNDAICEAARIDKSGNRQEFFSTVNDDIKTGNEKFSVIKSKFSLGNAFKMGSRSLKVKPFRLVMTILLSSMSFTLFGASVTIGLFNSPGAMTDAAIANNTTTTLFTATYQQENYRENYLPEEMKNELVSLGGKILPVNACEISFSNNIPYDLDLPYISYNNNPYYTNYLTSGLSVDESFLEDTGFTLSAGRLPENDNEIALPLHSAETFQDFGFVDSADMNYKLSANSNSDSITLNDLIGHYLVTRDSKNNEKLVKITGFVDTKFGTEFSEFRKRKESISWTDEKFQDLYSAREGTIHSCAFIKQAEEEENHDLELNEYIAYTFPNGDRNSCRMGYYPSHKDVYFFDGQKTTLQEGEAVVSPSAYFNFLIAGNYSYEPVSGTFTPEGVYEDFDKTMPMSCTFQYRDEAANFLADVSVVELARKDYDQFKNQEIFKIYYEGRDVQSTGYYGNNYSFHDPNDDTKFLYPWEENASYELSIDDKRQLFDCMKSYLFYIYQARRMNLPYYEELIAELDHWNDVFDQQYPMSNMEKQSKFDNIYSSIREEFANSNANSFYEMYKDDINYQVIYNSLSNSGNQEDIKRDVIYRILDGNSHKEIVQAFHTYLLSNLRKRLKNSDLLEPLSQSFSYYGREGEATFRLNIVGLDFDFANQYSYSVNADEGTIQEIYSNSFSSSGRNERYLLVLPKERAQLTRIFQYMEEKNKKFESYDYNEVPAGCVIFRLSDSNLDAVQNLSSMLTILTQVFIYVGLGLAVFSMFLFYNFISISINNKKREIGILRAVGAKRFDVFKIFYSESFIIAMINFIIASVGTFVLSIIMNGMFKESAHVVFDIMSPNIIVYIVIVAISMVTSLISALLPVTRLANKRPIDAIQNR